MMQNFVFWLTLIITLSCTHADVSLFSPASGEKYRPGRGGNVHVDVSWIDDGTQPAVANISHFTITLCTGPDEQIRPIKVLAANITHKDGKIKQQGPSSKPNWNFQASFPDDLTDDGIYFMQVISTIGDFVTYTIHYSQRFTLSHMSHAANHSLNHGQMAPAPPPDVMTTRATSTDVHLTEHYTIPYGQQTGTIRYAPMIGRVGSTTNTRTWENSYPKTSLTAFKKLGQVTPTVAYTITAPATHRHTTKPNTLAHASDATGQYSPRKRIKSTPWLRHTKPKTL